MAEDKSKKLVNKVRGEVPVVIGGEEHVLRFTIGAIREVKDYFQAKNIQEIVESKEYDDLTKITVWLAAGLRRGSMPDASLETVEEMLLLSEIPQYTEAINKAMTTGTMGPNPKPVKGGGDVEAAPLPRKPL